ncbi:MULTISPECIES: hypothetical protein [unclassified Leifsonia]|uniref:hypothetical protein n=1 Tax=unclassified Leifsonia TaxID=2663824 RepID=UPI0006FBBBB1|nr:MULTISPECIES: hypothetical protein [unclassified Leifsonia]KQX05363.1 hypothetical protein ASC59_14540 [Leifsonia sp. Root1293]KRA08995.1 hypothetical protein ASD61_14535 [Leifsonia sp. Root60]
MSRDVVGPFVQRTGFVTEESVYGIVLVSGMITASGGHGEDPWQVFTAVFVTVIVFWAAHVYAGTIAGPRRAPQETRGSLAVDFRRSLRRSLGFLTAALIPSAILLLGALRVVDDELAIWAALWVGVLILAVLGYVAFTRYGHGRPMRILGAFITALFGVAMIVLKALIH